jgi:UDP-galactopyranose mutase
MITIVGAGLAGLSAAYHLGQDYTILEQDTEIGGLCKSIKIGGYTFDYAPHIMFTRNPYIYDFYHHLLGDNLIVHNRKAYIYMTETYVKYPFEVNLYPLPEDIKKECIKGVLEKPDYEPKNFLEWIYTTMGEGIAKNYMIPYNCKIWKYPLSLMNTEWVKGRIPSPSVEEMRKGAESPSPLEYGPNAEFMYPKRGGIGALANSLGKTLNVKLFSEAKHFSKTDSGIETTYLEKGEEKTIKSDRVLSSIPLPEMVKMMDNVPDEVFKAAESLIYNSLVCIMVGVTRSNITEKHWLYFPERDLIFNRISFPMNFSPYTTPAGRSSILVEVTYRDNIIDIENVKKEVLRDLIKTRILTEYDEVEICEAEDFKYSYVVYDLDHRKNIKVIHDYLIENNILPIGRFGEWEYYNMDKAILSGKNAVEKIKK